MVYRFGQVELDEAGFELRRDGVTRHVEPKIFDLLLHLVRNRDRLVTKDELFEQVWPGTVVAESALTRAVSLARAAVGDSARGQEMIETVSGRGYRFRAPVEIVGEASTGVVATPRPRRFPGAQLATGVMIVLLLAGWATWPNALGLYMDLAGLAGPPEKPPLPDQPSVAVLPFVDLGPGTDHEYLAEGLADELTNELGRQRELFVIARSSAFLYRGAGVDVKRVGRDLGVGYVVEGSLRASGGRALVTAQLVDARSGFQLWSGRYEHDLGDVLGLQSEISSRILQALGVSIADAEIARGAVGTAAEPDAPVAYLLALRRWYRFTHEDNRQAQRLLERARVLRPDDPRVHALLASTHVTAYAFGWDPGLDRLRQGRSSALRAIDLDPFSARAHASLAAANLWMGRDDEALATAQRAVELGPNSDLCFGVRATVLASRGRLREAIRSLNRALRLNPRYPSLYWTLLGHLHQAAGRQERAVAIWESVREANRDMIPPRLALLAHYDAQQRFEEASALGREILQTNPVLTADLAARLDPRSRSNPTAVASLRARLRRAGIP